MAPDLDLPYAAAVDLLRARVDGDRATAEAFHTFLATLPMREARCGSVDNSVSRLGVPVEISTTGAFGSPNLRVLAEAVEPGEGACARYFRALAAVDALGSTFAWQEEARKLTREVLAALLPSSQEISSLDWRSTLWLSMRCDGKRSRFRLYVNLNWRPNANRFLRCVSACQVLSRSPLPILTVAQSTADWAELVGVSFDVDGEEIRFARLHMMCERLRPRKVDLCLRIVRREEDLDIVERFLLGCAPSWDKLSQATLVSFGIGVNDVQDAKFDVDLDVLGIPLHTRGSHAASATRHVQSFRDGSGARDDTLRYVGVTLPSSSAVYANAYWSASAAPTTRGILDRVAAQKAIESMLAPAHRLKMDVRGGGHLAVPPDWPDVYMTALIAQCGLEHVPPAMGRGIACFLRTSAEDGGVKYLPNLPSDLDDTAMVILAQRAIGVEESAASLSLLLEAQRADGGFCTFLDCRDIASHPAVTANCVEAIAKYAPRLVVERAASFLWRWLLADSVPRCDWMSSPLFAVYLVARSKVLRDAMPAGVRDRIEDVLSSLRRSDGAWGASGPEVMDTALAVLVHSLLGFSLENRAALRDVFWRSQLTDGSFCWAPVYSDGRGAWFGHRAITTTMALAAVDVLDAMNESAPPAALRRK